jgi:hypothetical protein
MGVRITLSEGRGSALLRAKESIERALAGDESLLDERHSAGRASPAEQKLMADLRARRIKPRKKRRDELIAADRRQLVAEFVKVMTKQGLNQKAAIDDAIEHFDTTESEVWTSLKMARK